MEYFPYHKQETKNSCGAASMRMALTFCGIRKSEKEVAKLLETDNRGTWNKSFPKVAEKFKLNYVVMRNASVDDLKEYKKRGYAIIIGYSYPPEYYGHFSVLKGIDEKNIYFLDPLFGENHKYSISRFNKIWRSATSQEIGIKSDKEKHWFFAVKK